MNKRYFGLGICSIAVSVLFASMFLFIGDSLATGAYAFGLMSGVLLISGLNLIFEGKKKIEGLEDTLKLERDC